MALISFEERFHSLLIEKEGSGLTKLAKKIASVYSKDNYEFLLCNSETKMLLLMYHYDLIYIINGFLLYIKSKIIDEKSVNNKLEVLI